MAGVAIVVISQIVTDQISGSNSGVDKSSIQELETKITRVCEDVQDEAAGEISLSSDTSIVLEGETMRIEGIGDDELGNIERERQLPCEIESRTVLQNTELYTATRVGGSYDLR